MNKFLQVGAHALAILREKFHKSIPKIRQIYSLDITTIAVIFTAHISIIQPISTKNSDPLLRTPVGINEQVVSK